MLSIRNETPGDHDAIREVNRLAFGQDSEALLVDRLRAGGHVVASLVAVEQEQIVGHILFSELSVDAGARTLHAAALAPMAVRPDRQRRGIGSALVHRGLDVCRERGIAVVLVVGHPAYYPRFGFSAALASRLRSPYSGDAFMAIELVPGALDGVEGNVNYPAAFAAL